VNRHALDELKQQIPLLKYLQALDWHQARPIGFGRFLGLCPLHDDHKPSFLVDPQKNLFYCYGCRRGGDIIRFAELYHQVEFPQAVALLNQWHAWLRCCPWQWTSIACSYTVTARPLPTYSSVESAPQR
jgi:DNA primase